jgi:hypothetical protein
MTRTLTAVALGAAALFALAPIHSAEAAKGGACKTHYGKGWAPTLEMAKFQSWEITAQVTGNWPIQTEKFKNERYNCKADGSGYTCHSKIDVCKN